MPASATVIAVAFAPALVADGGERASGARADRPAAPDVGRPSRCAPSELLVRFDSGVDSVAAR